MAAVSGGSASSAVPGGLQHLAAVDREERRRPGPGRVEDHVHPAPAVCTSALGRAGVQVVAGDPRPVSSNSSRAAPTSAGSPRLSSPAGSDQPWPGGWRSSTSRPARAGRAPAPPRRPCTWRWRAGPAGAAARRETVEDLVDVSANAGYRAVTHDRQTNRSIAAGSALVPSTGRRHRPAGRRPRWPLQCAIGDRHGQRSPRRGSPAVGRERDSGPSSSRLRSCARSAWRDAPTGRRRPRWATVLPARSPRRTTAGSAAGPRACGRTPASPREAAGRRGRLADDLHHVAVGQRRGAAGSAGRRRRAPTQPWPVSRTACTPGRPGCFRPAACTCRPSAANTWIWPSVRSQRSASRKLLRVVGLALPVDHPRSQVSCSSRAAGDSRGGVLGEAEVGDDAVLGVAVHRLGADQHLDRLPVGADHGGVQRAVQVVLGRGDEVLEPARRPGARWRAPRRARCSSRSPGRRRRSRCGAGRAARCGRWRGCPSRSSSRCRGRGATVASIFRGQQRRAGLVIDPVQRTRSSGGRSRT